MIYLGAKLLLSKTTAVHVAAAIQDDSLKPRAAFIQGILTNVLNPKVALFFLALLPQFIAPASTTKAAAFLVLGATFIGTGLIWSMVLAAGAARLQSFFIRNPNLRTMLDRVVGGMFLAMGVRIAWAQ